MSSRLPELAADAEFDPAELAADLVAAGGVRDAHAWLSRPAVARRVALAVARLLPVTTERIVAVGPSALAFGASLGLTTGLPWAAIDQGAIVAGVVHRGEQVVIVGAFERELGDASSILLEQRASYLAVISVIGDPDSPGKIVGSPTHSLFIRDSGGELHEGETA